MYGTSLPRSARPQPRCDGFTLVELLVVIGIIALLISILLPALSRAREQAAITKCAAQLRAIGQNINIYAAQNRGWLPMHDARGSAWLWDVGQTTRDALATGKTNLDPNRANRADAQGVRKLMYCPLFDDQNQDGLWNYYGYSVLGYMFMLDRIDANGRFISNTPGVQDQVSSPPFTKITNRMYLRKITDKYSQGLAETANLPRNQVAQPTNVGGVIEKARPLSPAELELGADATMSSSNPPYLNYGATGGFTLLKHMTSHMRKNLPLGGNILFLDGHVTFRPWKEMRLRHQPSNSPANTRFYF